MSTAARRQAAVMRTPVRTAARMIVEVGTSFNSVEPSVGVAMFTSAFEYIVCDGESNSVVGGSVVAAGLGMAAPCGVVPVSVVSCGVVPARVVPCCGELASVVAGCIEAVISPGGKGVSGVSQITAVGKKVSSAMYTLS